MRCVCTRLQADLAVRDLSSQHGQKTADVSDPLADRISDGSADARQAENSGPDQLDDAGIRVQQGADDDGVIDAPTVLASVHLAKAICESLYHSRTVAHPMACQTAKKRRIADLTTQLALPTFHALIRRFLYDQQHLDSDISSSDVPLVLDLMGTSVYTALPWRHSMLRVILVGSVGCVVSIFVPHRHGATGHLDMIVLFSIHNQNWMECTAFRSSAFCFSFLSVSMRPSILVRSCAGSRVFRMSQMKTQGCGLWNQSLMLTANLSSL
jgi:hypothetical protein